MVLSEFLTIPALRYALAEINPTERAEVSVENNEQDLLRASEKMQISSQKDGRARR